MLSLLQTAGAAQATPVDVFAFALDQDEPAQYVILDSIENHRWEIESIGSFSNKEHFDIVGRATVFNGGMLDDDVTVTTDVMNSTYSLFQNVVMIPVMSNRSMPILGYSGAGNGPYQMLPGYSRYVAGPGQIGAGQGGWVGVIEFSYHFDAYVTPA